MLLTTGFSILIRIVCTVVGILLTGGGLRALRTAKKEAYDSDSLKVNIWAAVIMIASGILLFIYGFLWVFRVFRYWYSG
jgi:UPF0716 family protein affecting phage T7 exclusion